MEKETPRISVIVPARDASATLSRTLAGLSKQTVDSGFEVIVVDNGSVDETARIAEESGVADRVIRRARGEGAGAARNDGVAASRGEVLAFIDSDCEPSPAWLAEGLRSIAEADIVAGAVTPPPGEVPGPFDRTLWVTREHGLYETANLFVRREWFDRLDGFHDWIPEEEGESRAATRPFGEDVWFAWRARRLGARTAFAENAAVYHAVLPGTARDYVTETWRLRYFPELMRRIPELREMFAWHRVFLSSRSAAFDVAAVGAISAAASVSAYPLVALAPYAVSLAREARSNGPKRALASIARDAVGFAALVTGSARARTVLL
jgi:glycosyltransferase involved in cell wall biosynthesis